jgi:ureidoacrylate peracid hydrolase
MRFRRSEAALLLVDLQRGFLDERGFGAFQGRDVSACARAASNCATLAVAARAAGVPVVWTRHVLRADHSDGGLLTTELRPRLAELRALAAGSADVAIPDHLGVAPEDVVLDKPRYSAFLGTALDVTLAARGVRALMVGGVTTSMCVESTVRDAGQRDIRTFVVRHEASLDAMAFGFARIVSLTAALAALGVAETLFPAG